MGHAHVAHMAYEWRCHCVWCTGESDHCVSMVQVAYAQPTSHVRTAINAIPWRMAGVCTTHGLYTCRTYKYTLYMWAVNVIFKCPVEYKLCFLSLSAIKLSSVNQQFTTPVHKPTAHSPNPYISIYVMQDSHLWKVLVVKALIIDFHGGHMVLKAVDMLKIVFAWCRALGLQIIRDHSVYAPSQWETALQCNVISHCWA